jgi:hypothetical protein
MKLFLTVFIVISFFIGCQGTIEKPDNLIPEDKMIEILYDFAILEGVKSDGTLNQNELNSDEFIYKKYKVDSLQLAKSNEYYSSDVEQYSKMYQKVYDKIDLESKQAEDELKKKGIDKNTNNTNSSKSNKRIQVLK